MIKIKGMRTTLSIKVSVNQKYRKQSILS